MVTNNVRDDGWQWIDPKATPSVGEGLIYASAHDIIARKRSGERVELQRRQLVPAPSPGVLGRWEWDIVAGTIEWCAQLCHIYGVESGGQRSFEEFLSLVHPDDRTPMQATVQTAYETRQAYALEHRIVRPDGVVRVLHAHGEVIADDAQRPVRMLGTSQDITERTTTRTGSGETEQRVSHGV